MRGTLLLVTVGALGGASCDAFSPQANVVATAAGRRLETDRLVSMLTSIQAPVNPDAANVLTDVWVNLNLFAAARVNGELTSDSASVARVMWPQVLQARMQAWQDTLHSRLPAPNATSADSAYDAGEVRVFQHIIVTPAGSAAADTAAARTKISGYLGQVRRGADFGSIAKNNADASKDDKGFLPVGPRGQFVKEFEDVAWGLEPGGVSDVVQTPFGLHLIRRAPRVEVQDRFLAYVERTRIGQSDSTYIANLASSKDLKVQANAAKFLKEAAGNIDAARKNGQRLASYRGGSFTVKDFARWTEAIGPGQTRQIPEAPDSVLGDFIQNLAQNALVIQQMDSAKLVIPEANWQALQLAYRATLDQLAAGMGLTDSAVADTTRPKAARLDSAASRVNRLMDQLLTGAVQFRPLPPGLAGSLRESGKYRVNRAGLARAVELATAKWKADSAANAAAGGPSPIQPAPGGPPVPGGDSAARAQTPARP